MNTTALGQKLVNRVRRRFLSRRHNLPHGYLLRVMGTDVEMAPPILDDVCMPPHVGPSHDDLTPLLKIVRAMKPRVVVELGTAHGNSAANICRQSPETRVLTVNAPVEDQSGHFVT